MGTSLMAPFMPSTADKVAQMLNTSLRPFDSLDTFGLYPSGNKVTDSPVILFARLDKKEVAKKVEVIMEKQRAAARAEAEADAAAEEAEKQEKAAKKVKKEVSHSTLVKNAGLRARSSVSIDNGMSQEEKDALIKEYATHEGDTGSPEVQIAVLSARIEELTAHLKNHANDHHSRRGMYQMIGRRRGLLNYLQKVDIERYRSIIARLGIRK